MHHPIIKVILLLLVGGLVGARFPGINLLNRVIPGGHPTTPAAHK